MLVVRVFGWGSKGYSYLPTGARLYLNNVEVERVDVLADGTTVSLRRPYVLRYVENYGSEYAITVEGMPG